MHLSDHVISQLTEQNTDSMANSVGRYVHTVIPFLYHTWVYSITGSTHKWLYLKMFLQKLTHITI
jgi:hypothetical protein